jgi:putative transposase
LTNKDTATEDTTAGEAPAGAGLDVRIAQELIEQARAQGVSLVGPGGLLSQVTRTVLQTALEAEMTDHLGYAKGDPAGRGRGNHRNGSSPKTVQTEVDTSGDHAPATRTGTLRSTRTHPPPRLPPGTPAPACRPVPGSTPCP